MVLWFTTDIPVQLISKTDRRSRKRCRISPNAGQHMTILHYDTETKRANSAREEVIYTLQLSSSREEIHCVCESSARAVFSDYCQWWHSTPQSPYKFTLFLIEEQRGEPKQLHLPSVPPHCSKMNRSLETVNILEAVIIKCPKQAHLQTQPVNYDILSGCVRFYHVLFGVYKRIYIKRAIHFNSAFMGGKDNYAYRTNHIWQIRKCQNMYMCMRWVDGSFLAHFSRMLNPSCSIMWVFYV